MTITHGTEDVAQQLGHVPLFQGLGAEVLRRIKGQAHEKAVGAGELFFNEGDEAHAFFVLKSGRVKLTQLTPEGHQVVSCAGRSRRRPARTLNQRRLAALFAREQGHVSSRDPR